jgi:hypothetical protein
MVSSDSSCAQAASPDQGVMSRVEKRRSDGSLPVAIGGGFRHAASVRFDLILFPLAE